TRPSVSVLPLSSQAEPVRKPSQSSSTNGNFAPSMPPQNAARPSASRSVRDSPIGRWVRRLTSAPVATAAPMIAGYAPFISGAPGQRDDRQRPSFGGGGDPLESRQRDVAFAVEHVVGAERDDVARRQDVVDAALHQPADVEVVGVEERGDGDAENVLGVE